MSGIDKCVRCEVMEDLLETATSERDKARDEAAKADREALSLKVTYMEKLATEIRSCRDTTYYFRDLARQLGATRSQLLERE